ncbi:YdcH family protein [Xanthobacter sp. TB0136]|uniref:YdcH family protein n=1 Tax=Xanthobacter sp. TB0136 TaxID=3459177 RepID=UPI004039130F
MSIQSHLQELKRRHAAIEQELGQEQSRPAANQARVAELKRKKLALKEQITKLGETATVH